MRGCFGKQKKSSGNSALWCSKFENRFHKSQDIQSQHYTTGGNVGFFIRVRLQSNYCVEEEEVAATVRRCRRPPLCSSSTSEAPDSSSSLSTASWCSFIPSSASSTGWGTIAAAVLASSGGSSFARGRARGRAVAVHTSVSSGWCCRASCSASTGLKPNSFVRV